MTSETLRLAVPEDIPILSQIHSSALPNALLSRLGLKYLATKFYPRLFSYPDSILLVAEIDGVVQSFVVFVVSGNQFEQWICSSRLAAMPFIALGCLRHPSIIIELLSIMRGPSTQLDAQWEGVFDGAELFSITSSPSYQGRGLGSKLTRRGLEMIRERYPQLQSCFVRTETDRGCCFYKRNGFAEIGSEKRGRLRRRIMALSLQESTI